MMPRSTRHDSNLCDIIVRPRPRFPTALSEAVIDSSIQAVLVMVEVIVSVRDNEQGQAALASYRTAEVSTEAAARDVTLWTSHRSTLCRSLGQKQQLLQVVATETSLMAHVKQ
ncbi:hypothetical protein DOTSEDRAFT_67499 [Dothistroma septosporum NZE10]|uniref:Uncharacterized protein n=1 Tax=Dothistroma septosporum (strain NZE10 / CBS 128990) TaxID=675120 RepID=N1PY76_DOTSN|nr:hypothetical protein DOTSEDRAFT_67499 [Dothistroma septosporum NZE10]